MKKVLDIYEKSFPQHRVNQAIETSEDLSKKGSIDTYIRELVNYLNQSENYFTTSSCSGRLIVFSQDEENVKKNCKWIFVTHEKLNEESIKTMLHNIDTELPNCGEIHLKFEPFILHLCCKNLEYAKRMLNLATANGFKNSGLSLGNSKIILAVRSTQNMEVPISLNRKLLVDHQYIRTLCEIANRKFDENFDKINKYTNNVKIELENFLKESAQKERKNKKIEIEKPRKNINHEPNNNDANEIDLDDFATVFE